MRSSPDRVTPHQQLGTGDRGDYVDYFVERKQREFAEAHEQITPWEIERYLQLY